MLDDEDKMVEMQNLAAREQRMEERFRKLVLYTCYVVVVVIISYGQRDPMSFYVNKHIRETLVGPWKWNSTGFSEVQHPLTVVNV